MRSATASPTCTWPTAPAPTRTSTSFPVAAASPARRCSNAWRSTVSTARWCWRSTPGGPRTATTGRLTSPRGSRSPASTSRHPPYAMAPGDLAMSRTTFDHVATQYDAARPDYPASLYDVLESALGQPLPRADVLDVGAGTGIATRALAGRGARVVAVDPGPVVLGLLRSRSTSRVRPVLGDGNDLPLRDGSVDLVTYAQSWHWTDPVRSVPEAARVLHDRGVLAVWWNFLMADGEPWFEDFTARNEASTPTYHRSHRGVDY